MAEAEKPGFAASEQKGGFVKLNVRISGLKPKSQGMLSKIMNKKGNVPKCKNATIEEPTFSANGFELNVTGNQDGSLRGKQFRLAIQQLPYPIIVDDCYLTADDDFVFVWLKKEDEFQSWERNIRENKLETAEPA